MSDQKPASLRDTLNYEPEVYYTPAELAFIRNTFKDNKALFSILRKALIPTISDPNLPLETFGNDLFMVGRNWDQIPAEEAKVLITARQEALKFIVGGLIQLKNVAHAPDEKERDPRDSSK